MEIGPVGTAVRGGIARRADLSLGRLPIGRDTATPPPAQARSGWRCLVLVGTGAYIFEVGSFKAGRMACGPEPLAGPANEIVWAMGEHW